MYLYFGRVLLHWPMAIIFPLMLGLLPHWQAYTHIRWKLKFNMIIPALNHCKEKKKTKASCMTTMALVHLSQRVVLKLKTSPMGHYSAYMLLHYLWAVVAMSQRKLSKSVAFKMHVHVWNRSKISLTSTFKADINAVLYSLTEKKSLANITQFPIIEIWWWH